MTPSHANEIEQIAQDAVAMTLNREVVPVIACRPQGDPRVISAIGIRGAWNGLVVVDISTALAHAGAVNMLRLAAEAITDRDLREVADETVNIVGGNLKGLLPRPSRLSLPTCLTEHEVVERTAGCDLLEDTAVGCDEGLVRVRLFARRTADVA